MFFDYDLPERLIAQHPAAERDAARLLVVRRGTGELEHRHVRDLPDLLRPGDRLVLNDTAVVPARLVGRRERTGGRWEGLFLRAGPDGWEMLAKTRGYPQPGEACVTDSGLRLTLVGRTAERHWVMRPEADAPWPAVLAAHGRVPLPPYIRGGGDAPADRDRYQTVYARQPGSVAAPTAGLHLTPALLDRLAAAGVGVSRVTLHVGLGTFAPVKGDPAAHPIHAEWCEVSAGTAAEVRATRAAGGRVVAVGTTTVRTLETAAAGPDGLGEYRGETALYIRPPHRFRAVDAMMTNFHLPRTTLLLLVQALSGGELLKAAYEEAIRREYRFYSYGDAMLVV
jgi:S-adenosylmethionine:tRNA ribosyltransferase-isomerase